METQKTEHVYIPAQTARALVSLTARLEALTQMRDTIDRLAADARREIDLILAAVDAQHAREVGIDGGYLVVAVNDDDGSSGGEAGGDRGDPQIS